MGIFSNIVSGITSFFSGGSSSSTPVNSGGAKNTAANGSTPTGGSGGGNGAYFGGGGGTTSSSSSSSSSKRYTYTKSDGTIGYTDDYRHSDAGKQAEAANRGQTYNPQTQTYTDNATGKVVASGGRGGGSGTTTYPQVELATGDFVLTGNAPDPDIWAINTPNNKITTPTFNHVKGDLKGVNLNDKVEMGEIQLPTFTNPFNNSASSNAQALINAIDNGGDTPSHLSPSNTGGEDNLGWKGVPYAWNPLENTYNQELSLVGENGENTTFNLTKYNDVFAPINPSLNQFYDLINEKGDITMGEFLDIFQPVIEQQLDERGWYADFKTQFFDPEVPNIGTDGKYSQEAQTLMNTQEEVIRSVMGDELYEKMIPSQRSILLTNVANKNRETKANFGNKYGDVSNSTNSKLVIRSIGGDDDGGNSRLKQLERNHDTVVMFNDLTPELRQIILNAIGDLSSGYEFYSDNALTSDEIIYDKLLNPIDSRNNLIGSIDGQPVYSEGRLGELARDVIYAIAVDVDETGQKPDQIYIYFNEGKGSSEYARALGKNVFATVPQNVIRGYDEEGHPIWAMGENEHWYTTSSNLDRDTIARMLNLESSNAYNYDFNDLIGILSNPDDMGTSGIAPSTGKGGGKSVWLDNPVTVDQLRSDLQQVRAEGSQLNALSNNNLTSNVINIEGIAGDISLEYTPQALANKYIYSNEVGKGKYEQLSPEYTVYDPVSNKVITGTFSELTSMFPTLGYDANGNYNSNLRTYDVKKDAKFLTDYNANTGTFKNPYVEQLDGKLLGSNKDVLYIPTSQYAALSTLIENKPNTNPQEYLVYDEKGNINLKESAEKQQKMDWVIRSQDEVYNDEITAGDKFTRFINENITPTTDAGKGALTFISDLIGGFITGGETLTVNPKGEVSPVINPITSIPLIGTAMDIGASVGKTIFGALGVDTSQADKTMSALGFNSDLFDDAKKVYNDSVNIVQNTSSENILDNSWKLALETSSLFNPLSERLYEYEEAQGNSLERMLDVASIALLPVGVGAGGVAAKAGTKIIPSAIKGVQKGASKTIKPLTYYKPVNEISENVVKNAAKEISTNASKFDVNPLNLGDYFAEVGAKAAGNTNLIKTYGTKLQQRGDLKVQKISNALKKGKSYAETTAEEVLNTAKGEGLKTFGKEAFDSVNALSTSYMLQDKNMTPEEKLSTMTTSLIFGAGLGGATRGLSALTRADNIIGKGANFITQPVFGIANKVATGVQKKTTDVFGKKVGNVLGTGAGFITGAATTPAAAPLTAMSLIYGADVVNRIATSDNKVGTGIDIYASEILPMILGGKAGYSGVNKILSRFRDLKTTKNYLVDLNERLTSSDVNVRNEAKNEKQTLLDIMFSDSKKKGLIDDYSMDILTDPKYASALDAYLSTPVKVNRKTIRNYIEANTLPETAGDPMIATFRPQYLTEENIKTAFRENRYGEKPLKTPEGYEMTESTTPVIRRIKEQYGDEYSLGYHATPYGKPFKNGEMPVLESTSEISGIYTASRPQEHYAKVEDLNKINFSPFAKFVDKDPMVVGILSKEGFQPQTTAFANNNMHLYKKHFGKSSVKPNTKAWYKVQSEIAKEIFKENPENRVVIPRMKTEMERIVFTGGVLEPVKMPPQWIMIKGERVPIVMKALSKNKIAIPKRDENGNLILDKHGKTQWDIIDYVAEKSVSKSKLSNSEKIELERFEEYVKEYDGVLRPEEKISADRRSGYEYQKSESSMGLGNIVWGGLFKNSSSPNKSKSSTKHSYKGTGEYSKSLEYSRSTEYPHSSEYSKSGEYSKPNEYSHSSEYSKSGEYSRSSEYGRSGEGNVSYTGNHNVSNSVEEPNRKPPKPSKKNNEKKEYNRGGKRKIIQRDVYHGEIYDPLEVLGMGHMASRNRNENTKFTGDYREYYEYGYNTTNRNVKKSSLKRPSHPAESFRPFRDYAAFDSSELLGLPMSKQTDKIIRKQSQERLNKSKMMDNSIKFWEEKSNKRSASKNKQNELFSNDIIQQFEKQNRDMFVAHSASNWDTVYGGKKSRNTRTMRGKSTFDLIGFPKSKKTKKNPFF